MVCFTSFNRINSGRSIPTFRCCWINSGESSRVSIVSIQADQSRLDEFGNQKPVETTVSIVSIQADQSRRGVIQMTDEEWEKFQSYQFRQINPDVHQMQKISVTWRKCFNRINSGRSIPTVHSPILMDWCSSGFQSYQFRQINPDFVKRK